jgi:uncharacterized membrane protein YhaH (DUF805 family)
MAEWYLASNGEQKGPYGTRQVQQMLADRILPRGTLVWRDGMADWQPIESVHIVDEAAAPVPPPNVRQPAGGQAGYAQPAYQQPLVQGGDPNYQPTYQQGTVQAPYEASGWFSFRGRISRKTYWLVYALPIFAINIILNIIAGLTGALDPTREPNYVVLGVLLVVYLFFIVPSLAASIKRLHDRDRSGWFLLLSLIPLVNFWVVIEIWFMKGTQGPNRFGPDPLG